MLIPRRPIFRGGVVFRLIVPFRKKARAGQAFSTHPSLPRGIARNRALLSILRHLPELLGFEVRTMVGLSNLTTGHPHRHQKICLEQAMVPMLAEAGVSMMMLNIFHTETVRTARTSRLLTGENLFTWSSVPC